MLHLVPRYQRYDFFREPNWRFNRANELYRKGKDGRCTKGDDECVKRMRRFLRDWYRADGSRAALANLFAREPGIFFAWEFYRNRTRDGDAALLVEARLLTRQSYRDIARSVGIIPQGIGWYERIFFNVRDKLTARDYILKQVLVPAILYGLRATDEFSYSGENPSVRPIIRPFLDSSLKLFAYHGGLQVLETMLTGFQLGRSCATFEDVAKFLDDFFKLTIRLRSAQAARAFEVNRYNVMELFNVHCRLMELEKVTDDPENRQTAYERAVTGLIGGLAWAIGPQDNDPDKDRPELLVYDGTAVELHADEAMRVAAGEKLPYQDELATLKLPPPRRREEHREEIDPDLG